MGLSGSADHTVGLSAIVSLCCLEIQLEDVQSFLTKNIVVYIYARVKQGLISLLKYAFCC